MNIPTGRIPHEILTPAQLMLLPEVVQGRRDAFWRVQDRFEAVMACEVASINPALRPPQAKLWVIEETMPALPLADEWEQVAEIVSERIEAAFLQGSFFGD